jgi:hypothetical protein
MKTKLTLILSAVLALSVRAADSPETKSASLISPLNTISISVTAPGYSAISIPVSIPDQTFSYTPMRVRMKAGGEIDAIKTTREPIVTKTAGGWEITFKPAATSSNSAATK